MIHTERHYRMSKGRANEYRKRAGTSHGRRSKSHALRSAPCLELCSRETASRWSLRSK